MKIGFVGLGAMGFAMAERLIEAGHALTVQNRTASKADPLLERGATLARTPAEAAKGAEIVFSMLYDDVAVEDATFGKDGIAEGLEPGAVHVCCSTISLDQGKRLRDEHARRGQDYAVATALGRPPAVVDGKLFMILAASAPVRERVMPAVDALGQRVFVAGDDPVQSNVVKLGLNFMIFSTIEQMSEVFAFGEKAGIAHETMFEIMTGTYYNAPVHRNYGRLMVDKRYTPPGAPMAIGLKDTELFLDAGRTLQAPSPFGGILRDRFLAALATGDQDKDFAAIFERARADSGLS